MYGVFANYTGSKLSILDWLYKYFPSQCKVYVEPFAGTGVVALNKPTTSELQILNDINEKMINMFKIIRDQRDRFFDYILLTPFYSKDLQEYIELSNSDDKFISAVNYFLYLTTTIAFIRNKPAFKTIWISKEYLKGRHRKTVRIDRRNKLVLLNEINVIAERFKNAIFLAIDYKEVLRLYDGGGVFMYLDPPYPNSILGMDSSDEGFNFEELLESVLKIKRADFLLSLGHNLKNKKAVQVIEEFKKHLKLVDAKSRCFWLSRNGSKFVEYLFTGKNTQSNTLF